MQSSPTGILLYPLPSPAHAVIYPCKKNVLLFVSLQFWEIKTSITSELVCKHIAFLETICQEFISRSVTEPLQNLKSVGCQRPTHFSLFGEQYSHYRERLNLNGIHTPGEARSLVPSLQSKIQSHFQTCFILPSIPRCSVLVKFNQFHLGNYSLHILCETERRE